MDKRLNRKRSVTREDNNIYIHKLNRSLCVSDFIRMMYDGLLRGCEDFCIHWVGQERLFTLMHVFRLRE